MKHTTALVSKIFAVPFKKGTTHYWGLPPDFTDDGIDRRIEMKRPGYLIIESEPGGAYLYRFSPTGEFAGDTWDITIERCKEQAEIEFNGHFSDWYEIPKGIEDSIGYALGHPEIFNIAFRIVLCATKIPTEIGPKAVSDILGGFSLRPWNRNVTCVWNDNEKKLLLQAENDYDKKGLVLKDEFSEELSACSNNINIEEIKILSVVKLPLPDIS